MKLRNNKRNNKMQKKYSIANKILDGIGDSKKIILISTCIISAIMVVLLFSTVFAFFNMSNSNIIKGIKISGVDISELNMEQARKKLDEEIQAKTIKNINIVAEDFSYEINLSQIEVEYNTEEVLSEAYGIGRNGNIFANNYQILDAGIKGVNINFKYKYSEQLLNDILDDIEQKLPNAVIQPSYCIENNVLVISKGKIGNSINKETLKNEIINKVIFENSDDNIYIELVKKEPNAINIDQIYKEIYKEPVDAYYTENPFQIFTHEDGISFDVNSAKEMLKEDKEEYEIKLDIKSPNITTDKLGEKAFPHLLSSFNTKYDASNISRSTNLQLAMEKIDGVIVKPGEVFSYNQTVGKRTVEAGYKEAGRILGRKDCSDARRRNLPNIVYII